MGCKYWSNAEWIFGKPEVYRLLEIVQKKKYVKTQITAWGYAHVGLISLAERVKSGENLNKYLIKLSLDFNFKRMNNTFSWKPPPFSLLL